MVNESVPLQSFWFSLHWRGSPSHCMSVWDLQEADTEIKLKMQRSFLVAKPTGIKEERSRSWQRVSDCDVGLTAVQGAGLKILRLLCNSEKVSSSH